MSEPTPAKCRSTTAEKIGWIVLVVSVIVGVGLTIFAPV
jgi:hypothetical protein